MAVISLSVQQWIDVPDNPRQRNTIKRAQFAARHHLMSYCKIHRYVYAASSGGEILCKLDGHTRAYLWKEGMLDTPPDGKVEAMLVEVRDLREAREVYEQLDSPPALKKPSDRVYGAAREHKIQLCSPLLRCCQFTTQLKLAAGKMSGQSDIYSLVKQWKPELVALDGLAMSSNYTVLIAVMLLTIRHDGIDSAGPFWKALDNDQGNKVAGKMDGPAALWHHIEMRRAGGQTAGWDNLWQMSCCDWDAYCQWKKGVKVKRLRIIEDLKGVIESLNKTVTSRSVDNELRNIK